MLSKKITSVAIGFFISMIIGFSAASANAAVVTLDFNGIPTNDAVADFYNGGTSLPSLASGTDYGVSFVVGNGSRPGTISSPGLVRQFIANVPGGFDTEITLDFVNVPIGSRIKIFDDLNLGGTQLFSQDYFISGATATATFAGLGKSIVIEHFSSGPEFDNLHFENLIQEAAVPEPSTFGLAALGLAGLGLVAWRRKK